MGAVQTIDQAIVNEAHRRGMVVLIGTEQKTQITHGDIQLQVLMWHFQERYA